jgi:hypothetical protein
MVRGGDLENPWQKLLLLLKGCVIFIISSILLSICTHVGTSCSSWDWKHKSRLSIGLDVTRGP